MKNKIIITLALVVALCMAMSGIALADAMGPANLNAQLVDDYSTLSEMPVWSSQHNSGATAELTADKTIKLTKAGAADDAIRIETTGTWSNINKGFVLQVKTGDTAVEAYTRFVVKFDNDTKEGVLQNGNVANLYLFDMDGNYVEDVYNAVHGYNDSITIPANFEGYYIVKFAEFYTDHADVMNFFDGETWGGGKKVTEFEFTGLRGYDFWFTGNNEAGTTIEIKSAGYLTADPEVAGGTEPTPSQGQQPSPSKPAGGDPNPSTGAPLMIGTAVAALASMGYVIKRKK